MIPGYVGNVRDYGLCFIRNAPAQPSIVESLALRIGPPQESSFGRVQDLIFDPGKRSIGNNVKAPKLHTDEPYRASPPGILLFHYISDDQPGVGSSTFMTGLEVTVRLRDHDAEGLAALCNNVLVFRRHFAGDKVLLVTGSNWGIGAEICRQSATEGWKVCVNYASSADEADQVVKQIRDQGGIAIALQANVANENEVIILFERIDFELGPVTELVNNAGINGGVIVNISSAASKHGGLFTYVDYAASKAAIDTFTIGLAKEQADQYSRVNCLRPFITMTEISVDSAK
jgi:hypothetical protein